MPLHQLHKEQLSTLIKAEARALGFFDCGISKAEYLEEDAKRVETWLEKGMQGEMSYLERNREKRYDATKLVEGAQSVISVLYNYFPQKELPESAGYKISKYAYGKDYHFVIKDKLKQLLEKIERLTGKRTARIFVDSAPVLDRAYARKSGLGFVGKNTLLINRKGGSFFFIGHIILDLELQTDEATITNFCGSCTKCIQACPTGALKPFEVDARKCISYLTIEYRGDAISEAFKGKWNNWIFGCDICQDVCPWNRGAKAHQEPLFEVSENLKGMKKTDWEAMDKPGFKALFQGTAVERTGYKGLKRNISFLNDQA
jgi:epoxyqueuosine reductase